MVQLHLEMALVGTPRPVNQLLYRVSAMHRFSYHTVFLVQALEEKHAWKRQKCHQIDEHQKNAGDKFDFPRDAWTTRWVKMRFLDQGLVLEAMDAATCHMMLMEPQVDCV